MRNEEGAGSFSIATRGGRAPGVATTPHTKKLEGPSLFRSFWLGGFESACHINIHRQRLDMIARTQHDHFADSDYAALTYFGIGSARDGVRWHLVDRGDWYDFSSLEPIADAADRHGVQVLWNLCHYGWPNDLDLFSSAWVDRYARYARAVARFFADRSDEVPFYCPMNEISYFAWAVGAQACMHPYAPGRADEVKRQLVRGAIAAIEAILEVDRRARFIYAEPLINVVTPHGHDHMAEHARAWREGQFEAWDMLCGRQQPELGGSMKYLDIMGLNYYASNQWDAHGSFIPWHVRPLDERWIPLHKLLAEVHERYGRPLFLSETSHVGEGRGQWIREISEEIELALKQGLPFEGICMYPIIDRPDWENDGHWHNSGLWDLVCDDRGCYRRVLCSAYASELESAQARLAAIGCR